MKVAVTGLWHLGCVTAACLANGGHHVVAYDANPATVTNLQKGTAPVSEPGLDELLKQALAQQKILFSTDIQTIATSEVVWVCFDTPLNNEDGADVEAVVQQIKLLLPHCQPNALVIISSQMPVGTIQKLIHYAHQLDAIKKITFACLPENLRLGKALHIFQHPDRIVIGLDDLMMKNKLETLLKPFSEKHIWMSIVSAEMTKHAINSFLALSVTFVNELAALCESAGADARDVERGLKSEERIGPNAYLRPGEAIGGGTLMRDVNYLIDLGQKNKRETILLSSIQGSNLDHKKWAYRKLETLLKNLNGKKVAMLGLTYKAGTDSLRRSAAIETCAWLSAQGVDVHAYDPCVTVLPEEYARFVTIQPNAKEALQSADAVVISTQWPVFKELTAEDFITYLKYPHVVDPGGFIAKNISSDERIKYFSVGVSS
jgi:UDPglucose 6-dehydrogenase